MKKLFLIISVLIPISLKANVLALQSIQSIKNCTAQQQNSIIEMELRISQRLSELVQKWDLYNFENVKKKFILPEQRIYSEGAPENNQYMIYWQNMGNTFIRMHQDAQIGLKFECSTNSDRNCGNGNVFAYVPFIGNQPIKKMYICPAFFSMGSDAQISTVFHELSHYSASTYDFAMDWWNGKKIDAVRASQDAYHVQNFVTGDPTLILKRNIWFWLWPK